MDGGGNFRANFGVERDGVYAVGRRRLSQRWAADLTTGYPELDHVLLKKLGWWGELTDAEKQPRLKARTGRPIRPAARFAWPCKNHGCTRSAMPKPVPWCGTSRTPIPQHREPLYGTRPTWWPSTPSHDDQKSRWRLPTLYKSVQKKNVTTSCTKNSRSS
jgi:formate dehydrogenase major subunit